MYFMNGMKFLVDLIFDENNDYWLVFDKEGNVKV